jgi:hypothetical protein
LFGALLLSVAFSACSAGGGTLTDEEFLVAARAAANASVLRIEDVPPTFRWEADEPADQNDSTDGKLTGECAAFEEEEDEDGYPGHTAFADGGALIGPTHEVNSEASVYRDEDDAERAFLEHFALLETCREQIVSVFLSALGPDARYEITFIETVAPGHEARGIRAEATIDGRTAIVDFLTIRQGRILISFIWGGRTTSDADRDTYAAIQAEKARIADEALPE